MTRSPSLPKHNAARHHVSAGSRAGLLLACALALFCPGSGTAAELISTDDSGNGLTSNSVRPAASVDGRYVAFEFQSSPLVPVRILRKDTLTGALVEVSASSNGIAANDDARSPSISGDGRLVVFSSDADNLIPGDTNAARDVFLKDLDTGILQRISVSNSELQTTRDSDRASISRNGRFVVFHSNDGLLSEPELDAGNDVDIYIRDLEAGTTRRVSKPASGVEADGSSYEPRLSADGNLIAFISFATNLVAGGANGNRQVYRKNLQSGEVRRISENASGVAADGYSEILAMSADGRFIAFKSTAGNLAPGASEQPGEAYLKDSVTGSVMRLGTTSGGLPTNGAVAKVSLSDDGRFIALDSGASNFAGPDVNGQLDVLVRDRVTGTVVVVSRDRLQRARGGQDVLISPDGLTLLFSSQFDGFVEGDSNAKSDIFRVPNVLVGDSDGDGLKDSDEALLGTDPTSRDSDDDGRDDFEEVAHDGEAPAFTAGADTDPLALDTDGDGVGDGTEVTFGSDPLDPYSRPARLLRVSVDSFGAEIPLSSSGPPALSATGRYIAFVSQAQKLADSETDTDTDTDVFLKDLRSGHVERVSSDSAGRPGSGAGISNSGSPRLSADGRFVVFDSRATSFSALDESSSPDVYLKDRATRSTTLVSIALDGSAASSNSLAPDVSDDARTVVFQSSAAGLVSADSNNRTDVFVRDRIAGETRRMSETAEGVGGLADSTASRITGDGRFAVFISKADNLVPGDDNAVTDVFVRDLVAGTLERVSSSGTGTPSNAASTAANMSEDGRIVAFSSLATTLVVGDDNAARDVFVKDRASGELALVSRALSGTPANGDSDRPALSADGRWVVFESAASDLVADDRNASVDVFVLDRSAGAIARVSQTASGVGGDRDSVLADISADGRFIAFVSAATNLVEDDANDAFDTFLATNPLLGDRDADGLSDDEEARIGSDPDQADSDGDGIGDFDEVAYDGVPYEYRADFDLDPTDADTDGDGLNDGYEVAVASNPLDASAGLPATLAVSTSSAGVPANSRSVSSSISSGGSVIAFVSPASNLVPGDTTLDDVFVKRTTDNLTRRVSTTSEGEELVGDIRNAVISGDGRSVVFLSNVQVFLGRRPLPRQHRIFVKDLESGILTRPIRNPSDASLEVDINEDGSVLVFSSSASNIVGSDATGFQDIFALDEQFHATLVSADSLGMAANGASASPAVSGDGRWVAFESKATNLVPGDTSTREDIFLKDRASGTTTRISTRADGAESNGASKAPDLSADRRFVTFWSFATDLVEDDTSSTEDVFVKDTLTGAIRRISVAESGVEADGGSRHPSISADGRFVAFESRASNLVPGDLNAVPDVFVVDVARERIERISIDAEGIEGTGSSYSPAISGDGRFIAYTTLAANIAAGPANVPRIVRVDNPLFDGDDAGEAGGLAVPTQSWPSLLGLALSLGCLGWRARSRRRSCPRSTAMT